MFCAASALPGAGVKFGFGKRPRIAAPNGSANEVRILLGTVVQEKSNELGVQMFPLAVRDWVKLPARSSAVGTLPKRVPASMRWRCTSKAPKKKRRSRLRLNLVQGRMTGPLMLPRGNWTWLLGR